MRILAIDTATDQVGVALAEGDREFRLEGSSSDLASRRQGEVLVPTIESLLSRSGLAASGLDLIGVDIGPGLFTGLRVGIATAKALAWALSIRVAPVTSLEALAFPELRRDGAPVVAVVDARRGEVFRASFEPSEAGLLPARVQPPAVMPPEKLAMELEGVGERIRVVGDGAQRYRALLSGIENVEMGEQSGSFPSPEAVAEMAWLRSDQAVDPQEVSPLYIREADVRIGWESLHPVADEPEPRLG